MPMINMMISSDTNDLFYDILGHLAEIFLGDPFSGQFLKDPVQESGIWVAKTENKKSHFNVFSNKVYKLLNRMIVFNGNWMELGRKTFYLEPLHKYMVVTKKEHHLQLQYKIL